MAEKAVILLSGGLDSTTCLAMAKAQGFECYTLGFDYGQRHNSELKAAVRVADAMSDNPHKVIRLNLDAIGGSALTDETSRLTNQANDPDSIPVTYVPPVTLCFCLSPWVTPK